MVILSLSKFNLIFLDNFRKIWIFASHSKQFRFVGQSMCKYLIRDTTDKRDQSVNFEIKLQCRKTDRANNTESGVRMVARKESEIDV